MNSSDDQTQSSAEALQTVAQSSQTLKDIISPVEPVFGFDAVSILIMLACLIVLVWLIRFLGKRSQWLVWVNWLRKQKKQLQALDPQDIKQSDRFQAWLWQTAAELHNFRQRSEDLESSQHFISTSAQNAINQWQNIAFQDFRKPECKVSRETMSDLLDELLEDALKNAFYRPVKNKRAS